MGNAMSVSTNSNKIQWQLQEAKAQFSYVVDAALRGEPQHVTKHGKDAVVVVSAKAFAALQQNATAKAQGIVGHLVSRPTVFAKLGDAADLFPRSPIKPQSKRRDISFK